MSFRILTKFGIQITPKRERTHVLTILYLCEKNILKLRKYSEAFSGIFCPYLKQKALIEL